jgi:retron-type reverse transcriptase
LAQSIQNRKSDIISYRKSSENRGQEANQRTPKASEEVNIYKAFSNKTSDLQSREEHPRGRWGKVKLNTPASRWQAAQQLDGKDYRPLPLKRCYIPKKNSKKLRLLSIPAMYDGAERALELMALNPIAECRADNHSYGFRKRRSIHDAIDACYLSNRQS